MQGLGVTRVLGGRGQVEITIQHSTMRRESSFEVYVGISTKIAALIGHLPSWIMNHYCDELWHSS